MLLSKKILVAGETCKDEYIQAESIRNSPEDPTVPIVKAISISTYPGMSENVLKNLNSIGCEAVLAKNSTPNGIVKSRIFVENKQIMRLDRDSFDKLFPNDEMGVIINTMMGTLDGLIVQDYGKGYWDKTNLSIIHQQKKPVFVDPYPTTPIELYKGCTLITPNLEEAKKLTGKTDIDNIARELINRTSCKYAIITLGAEGIALMEKGQQHVFQFRPDPVDVIDVCGAGDTVISVLSYLYLNDVPIEKAIHAANRAAGIVIQKQGTATVSKQELEDILNDL